MQLLVFSALTAAAGAARAGICDAAFMHEGGYAKYDSAGNMGMNAELNISNVSRQGPGECRARVRGQADFIFMGVPTGRAKFDHLMTVSKGQATFTRYNRTSGGPDDDEHFDLNMMGLFSYDRIQGPGQRLPGGVYRIGPPEGAPATGKLATNVRVGEKRVGDSMALDTAQGKQTCWPIRYTRDSDASNVMVKALGVMLPIPAVQTSITDWYCPKINMVIKQDISQGTAQSTVKLSQVK
jgi:hypothetical protein